MTRPSITFGMATYKDFSGAYFTLQSLRLHHHLSSGDELLIVDNAPDSKDAETLRQMVSWVRDVNITYIPAGEVQGTAAPRDQVFREAQGDVVVCLDSHVLLTPGSVDALRAYFTDNPDSKDLISGPMLYDDLENYCTHMDDVWRGEMWGTWAKDDRGGVSVPPGAWVCPCGKTLIYPQRNRRYIDRHDAATCTTPPPVHYFGEHGSYDIWKDAWPPSGLICGCVPPMPGWPGRHGELTDADWYTHLDIMREARFTDGGAFEIPAMGLGAFACRKEAWLGFNPAFRGFGGEEWYIHTKYRQAGHRALCLPGFRWLHRFGRPGGPPYPLARRDKVRNYILGHRELGLNLSRAHRHFVGEIGFSQAEWDAIVAEVDGKKPASCGGCAAAAQQQQQQPSSGPPVSSSPSPRSVPHPPMEQPEFARLLGYAREAKVAAEFAPRRGVMTFALLEAGLEKLRSHTPGTPAALEGSSQKHGKGLMQLSRKGVLEAESEPCDLLALSVGPEFLDALRKHAPLVTGRIILQGTCVDGQQDLNSFALKAARQFLEENSDWTVKEHIRHGAGYLILTRLESDRKPLPALWKQGWNVLNAAWRNRANVLKDLGPLAGTPAQEKRLALCTLCPSRNGESCAECGCPLARKTSWPHEPCPLGLWGPEEVSPSLAPKLSPG